MTPPLTTTTTTTLASTFRAKTNSMKSWRPRNPPSNRDRLELYALHKQSVSGDAPATDDDLSSSSSVADKAKLAAWRTKRGLTQADAMQRYVEECECCVVCGAYNVPTQPCIILVCTAWLAPIISIVILRVYLAHSTSSYEYFPAHNLTHTLCCCCCFFCFCFIYLQRIRIMTYHFHAKSSRGVYR
jgi:acyl-CoA-binding protein